MTASMRLILLLLLSALQSFLCWAQSCPAQQTPSDALGPFYVPNSPLSSSVAPESLIANPLQRLEVKGRVLSSTNCDLGIANVTVEVWYAGEPNDEYGDYYQDDNYRGQVVTDECGQYSFVQTFPALYASRPILHDHFRLSRPNGDNGEDELLVTQMYFEGTGDGFVADADSRKLQVVQVSQNAEGVRSVEFNMYVNLEGDATCDGEEGGDGISDQPGSANDNQASGSTTGTSGTSGATTSMADSRVFLSALLVYVGTLLL